VKIIVFFNNKGGVGKTSLVYHLAWMFSELGKRVIVADLDPQANLTSMFLDDENLEKLWETSQDNAKTIYTAILPRMQGIGDIKELKISEHGDIGLIPGDLRLSNFEDYLSEAWPRCGAGKEDAFRTTSAFYRIIEKSAINFKADLVLIDVGPNLGAINRSAIIASDYVVVPLASDLFSLQGLKNLGPALDRWRKEWKEMKTKSTNKEISLPSAAMRPIGYVIAQYNIRKNRPVRSYEKWMAKIPAIYRQLVLFEDKNCPSFEKTEDDLNCLAILKNYYSLMPMAMEARKPMFFLKPADGAIGSHVKLVSKCYEDFKILAEQLLLRIG
jgi:chromosome partitioning protein